MMARHPTSLDPGYFESMFRETSDPWDLETSAYEQAKFEDSIDALSGRDYANGFEVGCAKGVLTLKLAERCAALLAIDVSETALDAARRRTGHLDGVTLENMAFPRMKPEEDFDLIVLSEVAYYWDNGDLGRAADWLESNLLPGGDLLLVHYTGETDYPQSGDEAVTKLSALLGGQIIVLAAHRRPRYRLDLWRRAS
jgi:predicted TPR repeat methyltransferase